MVLYDLWGGNEGGVDIDIPKSSFPTEGRLKEMDAVLGNPKHGYFRSPSDRRHRLHYRCFLPPGQPGGDDDDGDGDETGDPPESEGKAKVKGVVVWQHGIQGHGGAGFKLKSGRVTNYALLSQIFVRKHRYALYTLDMEGHGLSEGTPRFYVNDWKSNVDDLDAFARFASKEHGVDVPLFVGGDSYGGCLALHVARRWQDLVVDAEAASSESKISAAVDDAAPPPTPPAGFRGVCLVAPAIVGDTPPAPVVFFLRNVLKPLAPTWTPFFMPNPVSPDRIWSDPEVRCLKTSEENVSMGLEAPGAPFRLGTASELLSALESVREDVIPDLRVPFCVSHGTDDGGVPFEGTEYLVEKSGTSQEDRALRVVEGGKHDLLSEPDGIAEGTVEFMARWMDGRVDSSGPAFAERSKSSSTSP